MKKRTIQVIISIILVTILLAVLSATITHADSAVVSISDSITPKVYNPKQDSGYGMSNRVSETVFGATSLSSMKVQSNGSIEKSTYNGADAIGLSNATQASLIFTLNYNAEVDKSINGSDWKLCGDSWGKNKGENVNGVYVGHVGAGAILVQTSSDGIHYSSSNKAQVTQTTEFCKYANGREVVLYSPNGNEINNGVYIRVTFAYEVWTTKKCTHKNFWGNVKHKDGDSYFENYSEVYTFYIFNNDPGAVTFHNQTLGDSFWEDALEGEEVDIDMYKKAESMYDGAITTTGFTIDRSLNSSADIDVKKNGEYVSFSDEAYTGEGRYDITVTTPIGNQKTTRLYVVKDPEGLADRYFGKFLEGKRIFDLNSPVPVFEAGYTEYVINSLDDNYPPMGKGELLNTATGMIDFIEPSDETIRKTIREAGTYIASFSLGRKDSGDQIIIRYNFKMIPEGSAPGPQVNRESLDKYASSSLSDQFPIYYSVEFHSAGKGNIVLAFATREAAFEYAYEYSKGTVEKISNGRYYYDGGLSVPSKEVYNTAFDLTEAINYFADQAVGVKMLDPTEQHTITTLSNELLDSIENLRTLELSNTVVIIASEAEREALVSKNPLPVISLKKDRFLTLEGEIDERVNDFTFVADQNGLDSKSVIVIDAKGNKHSIAYNEGLAKQLTDKGCPTGVITIHEENIYGDVNEYKAVFVREGECTATATLTYLVNGEEQTMELGQVNDGLSINTNAITGLNISNELDPHSILVVTNKSTGDIQKHVLSEYDKLGLTQSGEYSFTIISRLGEGFSFDVRVIPSANTPELEESTVVISFAGTGTEGLNDILSFKNESIILPQIDRYGYDLLGFTDGNEVYSDKIDKVLFTANTLLEPVWKAKNITVKLYSNGNVTTLTADYGTEIELPAAEEREGYLFTHWARGDKKLSKSLSIDTEEEIVLEAVYQKISYVDDIVEMVPSADEEMVRISLICLNWVIGGVIVLLGIYGITVLVDRFYD